MGKLLGLVLVFQKFLVLVRTIDGDQSVKSLDETLIIEPSEAIGSNFMYLYKTDTTQSRNYLNYRAVYGLRYSPIRKSLISNQSVVTEPPEVTVTIENEVISASENDTESFNDNLTPLSNLESEIFPPALLELTEKSNFTTQNFEPAVDESRNHIMRPNDRVEHALDFLAERLKKLLYYSTDKSRPESKLSPHLTTLGKFMNLFSLIKFENIPCVTAKKPLKQLMGTCYKESDCMALGGISVDTCAHGFGVCCVFKGSCGSVTHQNVTYFESPSFPHASQANLGTCTLTILLARDVKQVLVDFTFFELLPPTDGDCLDDRFVVIGQAKNYELPVICGIATGQHMFIDVEGSQKLTLQIITRSAEDRAFSIKVTQLSHNLPPQGCFQFHSQIDGIIKTFNYDDYSQIQKLRRPSYFNSINYSICIRRIPGYCKITFANELNGREDIFELVNLDADGNNIPGPGQAGAEIFSCQDDFIAVNYIRLCGSKLNDGSVTENFNINIPVQSYMNGPIVIPFKTNNNTVGRGFKFYYFQDKCL